MKRSSFLKTLVGLAVAPKVLAEITPTEPKPIDPNYHLNFAKQAYARSREFRCGDVLMDKNGNRGMVVAMTMGRPTVKKLNPYGEEVDLETAYVFRNSQREYKTNNNGKEI